MSRPILVPPGALAPAALESLAPRVLIGHAFDRHGRLRPDVDPRVAALAWLGIFVIEQECGGVWSFLTHAGSRSTQARASLQEAFGILQMSAWNDGMSDLFRRDLPNDRLDVNALDRSVERLGGTAPLRGALARWLLTSNMTKVATQAELEEEEALARVGPEPPIWNTARTCAISLGERLQSVTGFDPLDNCWFFITDRGARRLYVRAEGVEVWDADSGDRLGIAPTRP